MELAGLLDAVMELEREVSEMDPGDPRLGDVRTRIDAVERELEQKRGLGEPLVPDSSSPPSRAEATVESLESALRSLKSAVASMR